jgi:hypothetical protein
VIRIFIFILINRVFNVSGPFERSVVAVVNKRITSDSSSSLHNILKNTTLCHPGVGVDDIRPLSDTISGVRRARCASSVLLRAVAEVKRHWSVIGWVTKNYLLRASQGTLIPAAFAVVSTHQPALGARGVGTFSLCVIHKEGLCPSSGDINRLMMIPSCDI